MDRQIADLAPVVRDLLERGETAQAAALLQELLPADQADLLGYLRQPEQQALLSSLDAESAAHLLDELDDPTVAAMITDLTSAELAGILDEMDPDMAADLLGDLDPAASQAVLARMEEPEEVWPLLLYPDDSAGGLMTSQYFAFPETARVGEVFRTIREQSARGEELPHVYAVDDQGRLTGTARLADLIRAHPELSLSAIARRDPIAVAANADREEAARLINRYRLAAIPVLDDGGRLLGVITADDAMATQEQEATEDIYYGAGIGSFGGQQAAHSDLLVRGPIWRVWMVRVPFLVVTLMGGLLAGSVMGTFREALSSVLALALFVPVIMGMGGNVGAQSGEVFIRGHALGQIDTGRFWGHLLKEMAVGLGIGLLVGVPAGLVALVWQGIPELGLVVGLAIVATCTLASAIGFLTPYLLVRLGLDPAAGSSPFVTTIKDILGLMIYFGLATLLMGHLL